MADKALLKPLLLGAHLAEARHDHAEFLGLGDLGRAHALHIVLDRAQTAPAAAAQIDRHQRGGQHTDAQHDRAACLGAPYVLIHDGAIIARRYGYAVEHIRLDRRLGFRRIVRADGRNAVAAPDEGHRAAVAKGEQQTVQRAAGELRVRLGERGKRGEKVERLRAGGHLDAADGAVEIEIARAGARPQAGQLPERGDENLLSARGAVRVEGEQTVEERDGVGLSGAGIDIAGIVKDKGVAQRQLVVHDVAEQLDGLARAALVAGYARGAHHVARAQADGIVPAALGEGLQLTGDLLELPDHALVGALLRLLEHDVLRAEIEQKHGQEHAQIGQEKAEDRFAGGHGASFLKKAANGARF